jgi:hypothetical protein
MRRLWAILAMVGLSAVLGCGNSYDIRLKKTLEDMRYRKRLDDLLMPAQTKGKFEELLIFVRPPKNLQPAKEFLLPKPEPGKFDLEASFLDTLSSSEPPASGEEGAGGEPTKPVSVQKQSLHFLAKVKRPKNPNAKKAAAPAIPVDFNRELLALLNTAFTPPTELTLDKFKETSKKYNSFKYYSFAVNRKNVQVYIYKPKSKDDPYEVALVFEYPSSEHASLYSKIELCLESFAVGRRARSAFSGGIGDEQAEEGGAAGPAPGVF